MNKKLGIYIHVPFCKRKCAYCDFYSVTDSALMPEYIDKLLNDIAESGDITYGYEADTVYFGGGTPSLIDPGDIYRIISAIDKSVHISPGAEITSEANPVVASGDGDRIKKYFDSLSAAGVNRVSLGMQSASDSELETLGRLHRNTDTLRAVQAVRSSGIKELSLDLMYALPYQTLERWMNSVNAALGMHPEHLSMYALTLSDSVPMASAKYDYPSDDIQREMYLSAVKAAGDAGLTQYEISNFAQPGHENRHNLKYWRRDDYLGFGPGAHSFMNGSRFHAEPDIRGYINGGGQRIYDAVSMKPSEAAEEYIMLSLRTTEGLKFEKLAEIICDRAEFEEKRIRILLSAKKFASLGLCAVCSAEDGISFTPEGFFVSNSMIAELI